MEWVFGIVSLVYIIIAIAVLRRHYTRPASAYFFAAFCFSMFPWMTMMYLSLIKGDSQITFVRLAMVLACFHMVLFYFFSDSFIRSRRFFSLPVILPVIYILAIMILCLSPFLFSGLSDSGNNKAPVPIVSWGIIFFILAIIFFIGGGFYKLVKGIKLVTGVRLKQRYYILFGSIGMFGLILSLLFFNVVFLKKSDATLFAPLCTVPFIITTGYAMARYRFLDMSRSIIRIVSFSIPAVICTGIIAALIAFFGFPQENNLVLLTIIFCSFVVAFVVLSASSYLENTILKSYIRPAEIRDHLTMLANKYHSLSRFEKALEEEIRRISKMRIIRLYIINKEGKFQTTEIDTSVISDDDLLVKYFQEYNSILLCDEIPLMRFGVGFIKELQALQRISEFMKENSYEIAIPLGQKNQLVGLLFLTIDVVPKNISQVMQEFETLKTDATTGLQNLLLYRTSLDLIGVRGLK